MKMKLYDIIDCDLKAIVWETKRQKDILDVLDELLECARTYGWDYAFQNDFVIIEYNDGTTYRVGECEEEGVYRKRGIRRIIYMNANDTWVYGDYEVNEYGCVE